MQSTSPAARAAPWFEHVFDDIKQEYKQWEPNMSLGFLKELTLEALVPRPPAVPNATPSTTPSGNSKGSTNKLAGEDVTNNIFHFLEDMFGVDRKLNQVRTRDIWRKVMNKELPALPLSKVDKQPLCLAWHTKGQCNNRCPRASDHVAYTSDELKELAQWCTVNYPKELRLGWKRYREEEEVCNVTPSKKTTESPSITCLQSPSISLLQPPGSTPVAPIVTSP